MVEWVRRGLWVPWTVAGITLALAGGAFAQGVATPGVGNLPRDLSAWGMYQTADIVVKLVLIGLVVASLLTWTVALAKGREVLAERRRLATDIEALQAAPSLGEVASRLDQGSTTGRLVGAALTEIEMSPIPAERDGIKERIASRLGRIEAAFGRAMIRGTGLLATIGATAPFVGLFGTVWGIMNSFIGISKMQTTNLAVVAPGIAEALLATAAGLVVAIPAVVIYNAFSRAIGVNRALCADAAAAVLRLASRDLERSGDARSVSANEGAPVAVRRQRP